LRRALATLPRRQRAVIALRFLEDLAEAKTAEAMGCSVGTVKVAEPLALNRLRARPTCSRRVDVMTEGR
jgi:DNA-directed RNA polymerase specialized sigma24 family protein